MDSSKTDLTVSPCKVQITRNHFSDPAFQLAYNDSSSTLDIHEEKTNKVNRTKTFREVRGDILFLSFLVLIYAYFVWATVHFAQNSGKHTTILHQCAFNFFKIVLSYRTDPFLSSEMRIFSFD